MSLYVPAPQVSSRDKLGLALAGGGFRASLFHIGVLRRMAEMDLLRYVEVLSTVSGGSIVGALYVLLLKERLDRNARLTQAQYVELVNELQRTFVGGVQKNLRMRLFMNPLGLLSVCVSHDNLSRRMGRIYQRYLYRGAVDALRERNPDLSKGGWLSRHLWPLSNLLWPGWIPLHQVQFTPGGKALEHGLEAYNKSQLEAAQPGSAVPNFILNSTALNSAAPFRFSSIEIGDPRLGYFRFDEIGLLSQRKTLVESSTANLRAALGAADGAARPSIALALWWVARKRQEQIGPQDLGGQWARVLADPLTAPVVEAMCRTNFGRLRQLKLAAWYATEGQKRRISGGASIGRHRSRFAQVLCEIEPSLEGDLLVEIRNASALGMELIRFALELYYLRSAEVMSPRLCDDFKKISLGTAVCASANFPPVFSPLILLGIYDDLHVSRLGLSDGGVYDNLGMTTLLDEGCTHIIASDTGAPFEVQQRSSSGYVGMITRLPSILTDDVAEQQHIQLRERRRVSQGLQNYDGTDRGLADLKQQYGLKGLAFFSIDSLDPAPGNGAGIEPGCDREEVARLRTDLDSFGDLEVAALINTGYDRAGRFLRAYFLDPPYRCGENPNWNSAPTAPYRGDLFDASWMKRVLATGRSRFFRALCLRSVSAWSLTLAVAVLLVYLGRRTLERSFSAESLLRYLGASMLDRLENPIHRSWARPLNTPVKSIATGAEPLWKWFAIAAAVVIGYAAWTRLAEAFKRNLSTSHRATRKLTTIAKWIRAFAPACLLGVGLLPLWIAGVLCAIANAGYWLYNGCFLSVTRIPKTPAQQPQPGAIAPQAVGGAGGGGS